ncbi:MAG: cyclase, partial [Actinobacteria bacterium]|nr:cyclase [Actinomycetota bacterium]
MADQTESSIEINATPAQIMDVIADLPAYPQ